MQQRSLRAATPGDASAIAGIINHEIRTGLAIWRYAERSIDDIGEMIESRLRMGHAVYVAEIATEIVGWASYSGFRTGEGYARTMEHSVHIMPSHQRKGLARALMGRLIEHADAANVHTLIGGIDSTNTASIALHESLGFEEVGRLRQVGWKFDRWLTLVLMQWIAGSAQPQK